ncbi:uncharacterized protein LOC123007867 isoform X2 [Tribolium madens]|uniref:uncharacterized protein LOC123007867 isoform X2 n=1 Tax=Tribolium madens TaxID=41895 RepID=UPI001CF74A9C|nr:uncharacterized protein LOC123007867 isoform X2 [Tribolium madens]
MFFSREKNVTWRFQKKAISCKPLMEEQPKGFNVVLECDVPFPLPSGTTPLKDLKKFKNSRHYRQKRDILLSLEKVFNKNGLDGNACVKRIICEAQEFVNSDRISLLKDILKILFSDFGPNYVKPCYYKTFFECPLPLMESFLSSF